jgi:hypothetical protein
MLSRRKCRRMRLTAESAESTEKKRIELGRHYFNFTMLGVSGIMLNVMAAFSKVFWPLPA